MPISIEDLKAELIENHSEDEVNSFIQKFGEKNLIHFDDESELIEFVEVFGEKNLKYFDEILEAKNKLLECSSLTDDEVSTAVVEFIDNFSVLELSNIQDSFNGKYESLLEFARQLFDDCYIDSIPPRLRIYVDYQKFCDDLEFDYLITESGIVFCKN